MRETRDAREVTAKERVLLESSTRYMMEDKVITPAGIDLLELYHRKGMDVELAILKLAEDDWLNSCEIPKEIEETKEDVVVALNYLIQTGQLVTDNYVVVRDSASVGEQGEIEDQVMYFLPENNEESDTPLFPEDVVLLVECTSKIIEKLSGARDHQTGYSDLGTGCSAKELLMLDSRIDESEVIEILLNRKIIYKDDGFFFLREV